MEIKYGGRLPDWRYRAMSMPAPPQGQSQDAFQEKAHGRLAAQGLPWCFGEMDYPHWRRIPLFAGDARTISYYIDDGADARESALERLILCARCQDFDRCHKLTMAKKSVSPNLSPKEEPSNLLASLARM